MSPRTSALALVALLPFAALLIAEGQEPKEIGSKPVPEVVELSGILRRPVKWTPQLELWPAGQIQRIDVQGKLLDDVKEGTPIHVRGVVRTRLHRGGPSSPFPAQWIIALEVTELEILKDPMVMLERTDGR
ncbi:MAG: hypothetical protein H0T47_11675 [Planctomycetaceae bacterium]|nr:hypothetical protein [Planctomycetaceae bacterium]